MGAEKLGGRLDNLYDRILRNKITITIALAAIAAVVLAATTCYFYDLSGRRAAQISQMESDYRALNATYDTLASTHAALVASNDNLTGQYDNLTGQYDNLTGRYNSLSSNESSIRSAYDGLSATVGRIQEKNGAVIALYYKVSRVGTGEDQKLVVNATAYNMGDRGASRFTIHCRIIYDGQPSQDDAAFTNVAPLDKRSYSWDFSPSAQVDRVWVD